ncbi:MAG: ABC transporter ATP-binding protein [Rhodospirillales bacterium]|jgi:putative spermidine/putrescine transport system ATP-binding protein|nr:ABC transporter ATP-binding protein [Rhodospirillales bacterium]
MAQLSLVGINKRFGTTVAVDDVSLEIASGEFVTLVGASGCGKTTLLRIIAGFTTADSGELTINGRHLETLPPSKREIGFVFQSYALFPTQTIAQNIGFALRVRSGARAEIEARVAELCELTRLRGLENRYPHELSGGQQQRVALARALAPNPKILLLDEPLSALDAKIRAHLRAEVRGVVKQYGITTVYVTHDQEEALSMSDRVAVMDLGRIRQLGNPVDVYLKPSSRFVADFIGTSNSLSGRTNGDGLVHVEGHDIVARVPDGMGGDECIVCVRPEHVSLARANGSADKLGGRLTDVAFLGQTVRATFETKAGTQMLADISNYDWLAGGLDVGEDIEWSIAPDRAIVFAPEDA